MANFARTAERTLSQRSKPTSAVTYQLLYDARQLGRDDAAPKPARMLLERWYGRGDADSDMSSWVLPAKLNVSKMIHMAEAERETMNALRKVKDLVRSRLARRKPAAPENLDAYPNRVYTACAHRKLLITKRGYIGLAPWNASTGDVVAVLHGGKTPFLLRPQSLPGRYSLLASGSCMALWEGKPLPGSMPSLPQEILGLCKLPKSIP